MSKLDVFLWFTVKCYSEDSAKRYRQKDIDKLKKMSGQWKYKKDLFTGK